MIPTEIPALCSPAQGAMLQKYAMNKTVLEVGAYFGFSTVCMAQFANMVYSLDTHTGDVHLSKTNTFQYYMGYLQRYRVLDKVAILIGLSTDILPRLPKDTFDMAFIDATHTYEAVKKDIELTIPLVKSGGLISFHDYQEGNHVGVQQAVDEFIAQDIFRPIDREDTLLICRFP